MINPIGFGKPQDKRIDLHIDYKSVNGNLQFLLYIELNGETFYLQPYGNKKKYRLQFEKALHRKLGDRIYEQ